MTPLLPVRGRAARLPHAPSPQEHSSLCSMHDDGLCGSCPHLGLPLEEQIAAKQSRTATLLARHVPAAAWQAPCPSAPTRFRNKAKMVVAGTARRPTLGILDGAGHGVDLRSCPLHVPAIQRALPVLADLVRHTGIEPYDVPGRHGELKHILVTASPDEDLMVRFVLRSRRHLADLRAALPGLRRQLPQLAVSSVNIQGVHQAVIEGPEEILLTEEDRLVMRLRLPTAQADSGHGPSAGTASAGGRAAAAGAPGAREAAPARGGGRARPDGLVLNLPTRSFFQTNTEVAESLYSTARSWACGVEPAAPPGPAADGARAASAPGPAQTCPGTAGGAPGSVWDLFCGVGGFALALAGPGCRVLGVEASEAAVDGARESARRMGLDPREARFEVGDARVLDPRDGPGGSPDLLVVNPPRRGVGARLADRIEASRVRRVLYSSCNPASLAADLERMPSLRVVRARLFDMFPHTDHAEVLVELHR